MANIFYKWYDRELTKVVIKEGIKAIKKACHLVEGDAKYFCPVDTGRLRSSISSNWSGSGMAKGKVKGKAKEEGIDGIGQPAGELTGVVGTNVEYARRIEFGFLGKTDKLGRTFFQPSLPYLRTAMHKNEKKIVKLFKDLIK